MSSADPKSSDSRAALDGVRVLELGEGVAVAYCGKLLGDLGADVIKVEGPDGDPTRAIGPFPNERFDRETSALYLYLNTSKRGLVCDGPEAPICIELQRLARETDVILHSGRASLTRVGLASGDATLADDGPIVTSITPYGATGPSSDLPGDELTVIHAGGLGNLLPTRSVDISRPPVKMGGWQVGYHGGIAAALATLAALWRRRTDGGGELVDISLQDVIVAMSAPYVTGWRYHGNTWSRVPDRPPAMGRLETRDGYVILNAFDDHHFAKFREIMGNPEWCAGDEWLSLEYRANHLMEIADRIEEWARTQSKHELHRRLGEARIPIGPINDAADVLASPQYRARRYFVDVEHSRTGVLRYAGWPYHLSASPPRVSRPAPLLGEHQHDARWMQRSGTEPTTSSARASRPELPLAGVRVLELCWVWAGPYAGMMLASLGADVIKIESHNRPDLMRRSVIWPLPDERPRRVPPNQGMAFNSVNMGKRSIALDLATSEGAALARELAARSDVVIDNMRPGALDRLGLGYQDLSEVRSDLIVASSSGRGRGGPESEYLGYAMIHQGIGGGAYITGHTEDHPCHSLGDVDLMNAMTLAIAVLAALQYRARTGRGQFIDFSQCEGVTSLLGDVLLGHQMTGEIPERAGNRHPTAAPHGVYPAWGVDRWLAIEVHSKAEFRALASVLGQPELAGDPRFTDARARKAHEEEIDEIVAAWTRQRDRDWLIHQLRTAGVTAAPSRDGRDLYADRHLRERGTFVELQHPELGTLELVAPPFRIDGVDLRCTAAPGLGQHTDEILSELLGLDSAEIEALRKAGVAGPR